jgi:hypothetical protein
MTELLLHGRPVATVFDLLGDNEDDVTYSFGWALANSERLVRALLARAFGAGIEQGEATALLLQQSIPGAGRTDIEIETEQLHLILEAKRGWELPSQEQLAQYAGRFEPGRQPILLAVSECSPRWASSRLPNDVAGVPVRYLRWSDVAAIVEDIAGTGGGHAERRLLREFVRYLKGLMTMQDPSSNLVFVVVMGQDELFDSGVSFADVVLKHNRYFHPMGGGPSGWPKTPPNYVGFRFDGRLQQIRHVESYVVHDRPWDTIPGLAGKPDWPDEPSYLYELGPVIEPSRMVKTGKLWPSGRTWAALDLLLTCGSVSEARDQTNERLAAAGAA